MVLPIDTITWLYHIDGIDDIIIDNTITTENPATILGISFTQEKDLSTTALLCGQDTLFINWAKDVPYAHLNYVCEDTLKIEKTGSDEAFVIINYVKRDNTVPVVAPATTTPAIYNSITYGDVLTSFFLFVLLVGLTFGFLVKRFIMTE